MALQGDLSEFPLTDIIQLLDLSKKTGGVQLQGQRGSEQLEGWLFFRDGKIIGARLGNLPPLEAAYTFFTIQSGPFRFHEEAQLEVPTITQSNEVIIMEGIMRQDAWAKLQSNLPSLSMVPQIVTNPSATGGEINLEADEWRVLTMVNGRNTIAQIAQRSGLGEMRTCEIVARLLKSGLIMKREQNLAETLFPEFERIVTLALGSSALGLLEESYARASIGDRSSATRDQVLAAIDAFEVAAVRVFGTGRTRQPLLSMREHAHQLFNGM